MKTLSLMPEMAIAWADGWKTMTRRLMKPQPVDVPDGAYMDTYDHDYTKFTLWTADDKMCLHCGGDRPNMAHWCPRFLPGDEIRLLTTWAVGSEWDTRKPTELPSDLRQGEFYREFWSYFDSPEKPDWCGKLRPGRFLPNFLRHLMPTTKVLDRRAERVQEITSSDAVDEGVSDILMNDKHPLYSATYNKRGHWTGKKELDADGPYAGSIDAFATLWESIYGEGAWDRNDLVWVYKLEGPKGETR